MAPNRIFLVYEDERVSFEAFYRAVSAFMRELQAAGVKKGDRVALTMRNLPEWPVVFYAGVSLGAVVTPLNAWWTGPELEYGLTDSGAKVLVTDAERYNRLEEHLPNCPALTGDLRLPQHRGDRPSQGEDPGRAVIGAPPAWADLPDRPLPDADVQPDDPATIFYTSGTTGKPKGALASHRNITSNVMAAGIGSARAFLRRGEAPPAPDPQAPQRSILLSVPFFHATGCFSILSPTLVSGGKIVMMYKWDVMRAFELIEREKIVMAGGVPTIAWQLIEHPARGNYDLSSSGIGGLRRRALGPGAGAQDRGDLPQVPAGSGMGHDRDLRRRHRQQRRGLRAHRPTAAAPPCRFAT